MTEERHEMVAAEVTNAKRTAVIVGVLFLTATLAGVLSQVTLGSLLDDPADLTRLAANENQLRIGALLDLITAAAVAAIPVMMFRVLRQDSEATALGYLAARLIEAVVIVVGSISLLALVALSEESVGPGATNASDHQTLGDLLLAVRDATDLIGTQIVFAVTALILNYSLYRSRLVPRPISVWGLIGAPLALAAGLLGLFGLDPFSTLSVLLFLPIAVNEMVLAVWLIVKGFDSPATESG
jgi:hypothetical protein